MPNGGVFNSGMGLRLQAVAPGVKDLGNAHASGTIYSEFGAVPLKNTYGGFGSSSDLWIIPEITGYTTPSLVMGQNIRQISGTFTGTWQGRYTGAVVIGNDIRMGDSESGNPNQDAVLIGRGVGVYRGAHKTIAIGGGAIVNVGNEARWDCSGTAVGCDTKIGGSKGSVIIGASAGEMGSVPDDGSGVFANTCIGHLARVAATSARNIVISYNTLITGKRNIYINTPTSETLTMDDTITIGNSAHTTVMIGGINFSGGIGAKRRAVADASVTAAGSDGAIAYTSISAARTVTLPAANAVPAGTRILVCDESGSCSAGNTITIQRAGADTINGAASLVMNTAYAVKEVMSDGTSKWTVLR